MKVLSVVGARPQFIKAAVVSREIRRNHCEILLHTGQHYDDNMSQLFFEELPLPQPDYHLGVGSDTHGRQTAKMLAGIEEVLLKEKSDWVLLYGDTNSTLAGALAAAKLGTPVAHVEAGLRSYERRMPEEINRVVTDYLSSLLFCPTETAVTNLAREGITEGVYNTGDVMYDAVLHYLELAQAKSQILSILKLEAGTYVLATIHRASTTDNPENLQSVLAALSQMEEPVIFSVHPRTQKAINSLQPLPFSLGQVKMISPVGYLDMLVLQKNARLVITDSGGVQKEAFFLRTPCVTISDARFPEWVETFSAGANRLVAPHTSQILSAAREARIYPYSCIQFGDGRASERICYLLASFSETGRMVSEAREPSFASLPFLNEALETGVGEEIFLKPKGSCE